jgi:hypothetical protein
MVIERIFLRRASDSIFKFLVFMQQWYPLYRQRDKERLDSMLKDLLSLHDRVVSVFLLDMFVLLPNQTLFRLIFVLDI